MPEWGRMGGPSRRRPAGIPTAVSRVLRALSICAPGTLLAAPPTHAQEVEPKALSADIPAQPLAHALETFARGHTYSSCMLP